MMPRSGFFLVLTLLAVFAVIAIDNRGVIRGLAIYFGATPTRTDIEQLRELLTPGYRWYEAYTAGPEALSPGVLLVPGCLGIQDFHLRWAEELAASGSTVLLADSFTPRGIESHARLEGVCEGNELWGFQRAADVLVALEDLRQHSGTDPNALFLLGWSHGGWAVLDAVALAGNKRPPPHLESLPDEPLLGLRGTFVFYPYCGLGSFVRRLPWPGNHPALIFLARHDKNIDPQPCRDLQSGTNQKTLTVLELDADHWFDNPEGFELVPHRYSGEATRIARENILTSIRDTGN